MLKVVFNTLTLCISFPPHCKTHSPTFQNAHFIWGEITLLSMLYNLIFDNDKYQAYNVSSKSCHHKQFLYKRQKCMCRQWKMLQVASSQWNIKWNGTYIVVLVNTWILSCLSLSESELMSYWSKLYVTINNSNDKQRNFFFELKFFFHQ